MTSKFDIDARVPHFKRMDRITYRPVNQEDLKIALEILQEDNTAVRCRLYSPATMEFFYKITRDNPDGFIVAEVDGRVAGVIIAHVLGPNVCCIGMNTVSKQYRGQGIGRELFRRARIFVGEREMCLSCNEGNLANYLRKGFADNGLRGFEYGGHLDTSMLKIKDIAVKLVRIEEVNRKSLVEYDSAFTIRGSTDIVDGLMSCKGVVTMVATKGGTIVGYGVMDTTLPQANRIGPLFADNIDVAKTILARLGEISKDKSSYLTFPRSNKEFEAVVKEAGYSLRLSAVYLFNKELYPFPEEKLFAITNYVVYMI